jgi:hypothetical protein
VREDLWSAGAEIYGCKFLVSAARISRTGGYLLAEIPRTPDDDRMPQKYLLAFYKLTQANMKLRHSPTAIKKNSLGKLSSALRTDPAVIPSPAPNP